MMDVVEFVCNSKNVTKDNNLTFGLWEKVKNQDTRSIVQYKGRLSCVAFGPNFIQFHDSLYLISE